MSTLEASPVANFGSSNSMVKGLNIFFFMYNGTKISIFGGKTILYG
jgi:hypothetical protein